MGLSSRNRLFFYEEAHPWSIRPPYKIYSPSTEELKKRSMERTKARFVDYEDVCVATIDMHRCQTPLDFGTRTLRRRTVRRQTVHRQRARRIDSSPTGQFADSTVRRQDSSPTGHFTDMTVRRQDISPKGCFGDSTVGH